MKNMKEIVKTNHSSIKVVIVENIIKDYIYNKDNVSKENINIKLYENEDTDYYAFNIEVKKEIKSNDKENLNFVEKYKLEKDNIIFLVNEYLKKEYNIEIDFTDFDYFSLNGDHFSFIFKKLV